MPLKAKPHTGIYAIVNKVNGRMYIGSAMRFNKRWKEHMRGLESGKHHSRFLSRCWAKHGADNFEFKILLYCSAENLLMYEQAFLDFYNPIYNTAKIAGSQIGYKHTEETRARMSASRPKDFSPMTGKKHSEETKSKISASRTGKGGGPRTPERLEKIRKAMSATIGAMTEEDVMALRAMYSNGVKVAKIARALGRSYYAVWDAAKGRTYRWIT